METRQPTTLQADWRPILWLSIGFAVLKLAIQIIGNILAQHAGYGIFRDELYYLVCGRHVAFGYVDQPPEEKRHFRQTGKNSSAITDWSSAAFPVISENCVNRKELEGACGSYLPGKLLKRICRNALLYRFVTRMLPLRYTRRSCEL